MLASPLSDNFVPINYDLQISKAGDLELRISGRKTGRPSKRITLHQNGIKILSAGITYARRNVSYSQRAIRVNHVNSFQQARLHFKDLLYPGTYVVTLKFKSKLPASEYRKLIVAGKSLETIDLRKYLPSVDERAARTGAGFTISYADEKTDSGV